MSATDLTLEQFAERLVALLPRLSRGLSQHDLATLGALTQPQILSVQADDAPLVFKGPLASAARAWVEQAFDDRVVYTVSAQDLQALLARGWRPGGISVIEQGLRVTLVAAGPS